MASPGERAAKLSVVIVGGGIGGLALAIFLKQDGHRVTVLERGDGSNIFGRVSAIGDTGTSVSRFRYTGELIAKVEKGVPYTFVHRGDLLEVFFDVANELGVHVRFNATVKSVADSKDGASVTLSDESKLQADVVFGADGINSFTRSQIFPDIKPEITPCCVMLVNVPGEAMKANDQTSQLYADLPYHATFGAQRNIISWTMTGRKSYNLQFCDFAYENGNAYGVEDLPDAPYITTIDDMSGMKKRWSDYGPQVQHILDSTSQYTRWRIAQLPPMNSYVSTTGRVWLLGDACHAVKPFAGQGANMAIEDAGAITTLLAGITSANEIEKAARIYDELRVPRIDGLRVIIESNVKQFGLADGEEQRIRDAKYTNLRDKILKTRPEDDVERMVEKARWYWLERYNAIDEALKAWQSQSTSVSGATASL